MYINNLSYRWESIKLLNLSLTHINWSRLKLSVPFCRLVYCPVLFLTEKHPFSNLQFAAWPSPLAFSWTLVENRNSKNGLVFGRSRKLLPQVALSISGSWSKRTKGAASAKNDSRSGRFPGKMGRWGHSIAIKAIFLWNRLTTMPIIGWLLFTLLNEN